jgi:hypothetical protein
MGARDDERDGKRIEDLDIGDLDPGRATNPTSDCNDCFDECLTVAYE